MRCKFLFFFFVIALIGAAVFAMLYYRTQRELAVLKDPVLQIQREKEEAMALIATVGNYIILPPNEVPLLGTVTDVEHLAQQQPFYAHAQNGDKILVYIQSQKAILYSPSRKIIVNVGPIIADQT